MSIWESVGEIYLRSLGKEPKSSMCEDAIHAIQTAKADGFAVVAVFDNSEKRQTEIRDLADYYIADFEHAEEFWRSASSE